MVNFTIGTDIEFFIKDPEGNLVPSQGLLGTEECGTKRNPIRTVYGTLQRDNVAVEFATPICNSCKEFLSAIRFGIINALNYLPHGYTLEAIPSANFQPYQLETAEAGQFGCDPDYSAWAGGRKNHKPRSNDKTLRSAGMHIHVGSELLNEKKDKIRFVKWMDYAFLPSIFLDRSPASIKRKELYGKAGAYRPTSYGAEYRSLSNFWVSSPVYAEFAYMLTEAALRSAGYYDENRVPPEDENIIFLTSKEYVKAFNTCDIGTAVAEFYVNWLEFFTTFFESSYIDRALMYKPKSLKQEWRIK